MTRLGTVLAAALLVLALGPAFVRPAGAHETTRSFVALERDGEAIDLRMRVAFRDIEVAVWMDEDLDGRITWGEARRRLDAVEAYIRSSFALEAGGACTLKRTGADASESGGIAYLDLNFEASCPSASAPLTARSRLFTEIDPDHRMFLSAATGERTASAMLSAGKPSVMLAGNAGAASTFAAFFRSGIGHLMGGTDHIVFLLALMLPAVCATSGVRQATYGVVAAVTGFTLAHALTLSAAMTELLRPPSALIEVLIALSIVVTAADNVRPFIPAPRAAVAAFFGIIHGFGFATALGALELSGAALAVALVGFNLGIEAAQVAVVLVTMPALYILGGILGGGRLVLWAGSAAAGAVGLWWLGIRLLPFATPG